MFLIIKISQVINKSLIIKNLNFRKEQHDVMTYVIHKFPDHVTVGLILLWIYLKWPSENIGLIQKFNQVYDVSFRCAVGRHFKKGILLVVKSNMLHYKTSHIYY